MEIFLGLLKAIPLISKLVDVTVGFFTTIRDWWYDLQVNRTEKQYNETIDKIQKYKSAIDRARTKEEIIEAIQNRRRR